jgi:hypothetical protein
VVSDRTVNRISFNGGHGGVNARPTREERTAAREPHIQPAVFQTSHMNTAGPNRDLNRAQPKVVKSNFSSRHANAGNFAMTAEGRRDFTPARMNAGRSAPRVNAPNAGERREAPQRGGGQRGERGRRE